MVNLAVPEIQDFTPHSLLAVGPCVETMKRQILGSRKRRFRAPDSFCRRGGGTAEERSEEFRRIVPFT